MNQKLLSDTAHTFVIAVALLAFGIAFTSLAGRLLGPEEFGVLQLGRRTISYLFPVLLLGLNTSLVREVGVASDPAHKRLLAKAAWWITLGACTVAILISTVFSGTINELLFGQETNAPSAFGFLLFSIILFTVVYSQLRSVGKIKASNWQLLLSMGFVPLASASTLFWKDFSGAEVMVAMGLLMLTSLVPSLIVRVCNMVWSHTPEIRSMNIWPEIILLITYGLPRAFVPVLMGVIYTTGVIKLNYLNDAQDAGLLLAMFFFLRIIDQSVHPIAIVMLPHLSTLIGSGQEPAVKRYADGMIQLLLPLGLCTTTGLLVTRANLIELLYGQQFIDGVTALGIIAFAALPVLFFSLAQTILDATAQKGWTMLAVLVGAVVSILGIFGQSDLTPEKVAIVFVISVWVVAGIMFIILVRLTNINMSFRDLAGPFLLAAIVGTVAWCVNTLCHTVEAPVWVNVVLSVVFSIGIFIMTSMLLKLKWIRVITELRSA